MTVTEVIAMLSQCDPDAKVELQVGGDGAVHSAYLRRVYVIANSVVLSGEPE